MIYLLIRLKFLIHLLMQKNFTVSALTDIIKDTMEQIFDENIYVQGEISNIKLSKNDLFMTLKDTSASINVCFWNFLNRKKKLEVNNGDNVTICGKLCVYPKNGNYSIKAFNIEKNGIGDIHNEYNKIKCQYQDKGYFDESRKKQLPYIIKNLGIITALDGAALQDILYVLEKNNFNGNVIIKGSIVQGSQCPNSISMAIKELNSYEYIDVIIIARGGGSFEDLMGFSDPKILEAIYDSKICIISAIGHEVDTMLSDFVADIRAPTPSIAGEIVTKSNQQLKLQLLELTAYLNSLKSKIKHHIENVELKIINLQHNLNFTINKIDKLLIDIDNINNFFWNNIAKKIMFYNNQINLLSSNLENLKCDNKITIFDANGQIINTIKDLKKNPLKKLKIKLQDGIVDIIYRFK